MRKKTVFLIAFLAGMALHSCSLPTLPKRVEIKGSPNYNVSIKIPDINVGEMVTGMLREQLSRGSSSFAVNVWDANYGQAEQAFLLSLSINITESLNLDEVMEAVGSQLDALAFGNPLPIRYEFPGPPDNGGPVAIPVSWPLAVFDEIPSISFGKFARYVKKINFDACGDDESKGIGLKFTFSQVVPGLDIIVTCNELSIDGSRKPLEEGAVVFGNTGDLELRPGDDGEESGAAEFTFEVALAPRGGDDTLIANELASGRPLRIEGQVEFFQNWRAATIDMAMVVEDGDFEDGLLTGSIPEIEAGKAPIDLSMLGSYFTGFTFDDVQAKMYLNGPGGVVFGGGGLELFTKTEPPEKSALLYDGPLLLGAFAISGHLDESGSYGHPNLPEGGMELEGMAGLMSDMPRSLAFGYKVKLPDEIVVTQEVFFGEASESNAITAEVVVLLPMSLTAGEGGGAVTLGGLIEDKKDIFGRDNPGDETDFSDMGKLTLHVSVEFSERLFSGGTFKLFENDPLFPDGIRLDGKTIGAKVSGAVLDRVISTDPQEARLLILGPAMEFAPGSGITIPRNIGVTRIKFGISGSYTVDIGDIFKGSE
ncbi:MAG: hypothetical protein LBQ69_01305 [Treponema sp.]|nr:hypothetical protein [Treponema sp.]